MVDASVVMVENAHKHLERYGDTKSHAAIMLDAARGVGPALFYSLLIITVSFLPVFSLTEQSGRLFKPLAYTKTFAMAASAVLAITIVPVLMTFFIRQRILPEARNPLSRFFIRVYHPFIRLVLRWRKITLLLAVIMLAVTIYPLSRLGSEFMPPLNEGDFLYMPTTLPGISITKAKELLQQTDKIIQRFPEVLTTHGKIGRAETATDPAPLSMIETTITLRPKVEYERYLTMQELADDLDRAIQFPGLTNAWTMPIKTRIDMLSTGIKTPVGIKLMGPDLDVLSDLGAQIEAVVRDIPGTLSVYAERVTGGNYLDFTIDRTQIARYGLTVGDVQDVIMIAIGGMNVTFTVEGLERYPVNLRYSRELRDDIDRLKRVLVPTPAGAQVPLIQLADFAIRKGAASIKSENSRQTAWIYVDLKGIDVGSYVRRAMAIVDRGVELPQGYSIVWSGQFEYMEKARRTLRVIVPVTLVLIFLLLYLHFHSVTEAMIVMASLPFALVGGVWLLYVLDYNLSVAVVVGFIALAGLAAETGVVMLVYLDESYQHRQTEGRMSSPADLQDAIIEGAVDRVRPKLMTVSTTLIGLLPVMWGTESGSEVMKRIAAPMVGGLVSSTILTLVIIPVVYDIWKRLVLYRRARRRVRALAPDGP
ncbi:Cation efflux system protein CusA [Geodia barretti]|uniref:Cation efflux system protein CusA n=1 Tax=Geodia barretti TaxID=519541 RepID=A0AA35TIM3_GEOBA|nr:Cation efflux system protein CusA [Geodia barretti]